jgi:hypothetical protein
MKTFTLNNLNYQKIKTLYFLKNNYKFGLKIINNRIMIFSSNANLKIKILYMLFDAYLKKYDLYIYYNLNFILFLNLNIKMNKDVI